MEPATFLPRDPATAVVANLAIAVASFLAHNTELRGQADYDRMAQANRDLADYALTRALGRVH